MGRLFTFVDNGVEPVNEGESDLPDDIGAELDLTDEDIEMIDSMGVGEQISLADGTIIVTREA